jgi:site-specific recombinase XerD
VTKFLERMREELVRRNYAESTIRSYMRIVKEFQQYAGKRLDHLGPDDLRHYHAHLPGSQIGSFPGAKEGQTHAEKFRFPMRQRSCVGV